MSGADRVLTFIVRVVESSTGDLRAVVERVRTGRKQQVQTVEGIGLVIAAMALEEPPAEPAERTEPPATIQ